MSIPPLERKLAAILYADVAGYSRLTGEDEEGTHRTLRAFLDAISSHIHSCNGRVVHYAGDAVLAEFGTVSEALSCAVDVQRDFKVQNQSLPDNRKVQFRIGVNLGEVILDKGEIYGDGVNVAARLENLSDPGGIAISESVRTSIGTKLPIGYVFLGEQKVKNIIEPVRAYQVRFENEVALRSAPGNNRWKRWTILTSALVIVLTILGGLIGWIHPWLAILGPASVTPTTVAMSGRPSIAVLPFTNISGDPEQEYFSDGITDDLITDLSKISGLFVIARNSVFVYKDKAVKIMQVADDLGVGYVLEGSVRRAGNKVRINAQLIDGITGGHLWAERYDGSIDDVFGLQDQVTRRIVAALKVQLTPQEKAITTDKGTDNVAAYDAFLKGWEHLLRRTPEDAIEAIAIFKQATKLDPTYGRAYAALAETYWEYSLDSKFNRLIGRVWGGEGYMNDVAAWEFLRKSGDRPLALSHALAARMLQRQRRFGEAMQEARQAVSLGPSNPIAYDALIETLIYAGEVEEALSLIDKSMGLDPTLPGEKLFLRGFAYYTMGRLTEALSAIERARTHNPKQTRYAAIQAVTLAELNRADDAKLVLEDYRVGQSAFITMNWIGLYWPFEKSEQAKRFAAGLQKAGMPVSLHRHYVVSPQNRLQSDELKALLANKTMIGIDLGPAGGEEFIVKRNGSLQIVGQDLVTYFHEGTGRTRVDNDLLCDPWRDFHDYCVAIFRNPDGTPATKDEYVFFTLFGIFTFSVFDLED